jgi:hypothetical protein
MKVTLGWTYKDVITGFKGVATGYVQYITGCNQVLLNPKVDADGKIRDSNWFDEARLQICAEEAPVELDTKLVTANPGPDKQAPKR